MSSVLNKQLPAKYTYGVLIAVVLLAAMVFQASKQMLVVTKDGIHVSSFPIVLNKGESITLTTDVDHSVRVFFDIESDGNLHSAYSGNGFKQQCQQDGAICSYILTIKRPGNGVRLYATEDTVIKHASLRVARHMHGSHFGDIRLDYAFMAVLALVLLIIVTHRSPVISQWVLVAAAGLFLFYLDPLFCSILLTFLVTIYHIGNNSKSSGNARLVYSILISALFFLIVFKYFYTEIQSLFYDVGSFSLIVPLGISYFVIRLIDTQLKWYRNEIPEINLRQYLCFILFPATLPAGPIDTISHFYEQRLTSIAWQDFSYGICRIFIGTAKKLVLADFIIFSLLYGDGGYYNEIAFFPMSAGPDDILIFLILALGFVYLDFSAYSDIAVGFSRLLGYRMVENFNYPLFARNMRVFWTRWHMSLSNWCLRNIYFPIMISTKNFYIPTYIVMTVIGLWHALTLPWLFWGLHHASGISAVKYMEDKLPLDKWMDRHPLMAELWTLLAWAITFMFAAAAHAFTQFPDFTTALTIYLKFWMSLFLLPFQWS